MKALKRRIVALALLAPLYGYAQPEPIAPAPPPAFEPSFAFTVRGGGTAVVISDADFDLGGTGPYFELEVARRSSPTFELAAFASYQTVSDSTEDGDFGYDTVWQRERLVDVGVRARRYLLGSDGPFVGVGAGLEAVRMSGINSCTSACLDSNGNLVAPYSQPFTHWTESAMFELHAGVTLPKTGPGAIQLLGVVSIAPSTYSARIALGLRF